MDNIMDIIDLVLQDMLNSNQRFYFRQRSIAVDI